MDLVIGIFGKPNVGKSSFLNSACENAKAEVANRPFTTIEPNVGVTYFEVPCACKHFGKEEECRPRYGSCVKGTRRVPVKILDVAGLVPGASEGLGLGNKFLDDLRAAHVLLQVIDASGTTNEKGEPLGEGGSWDPCKDVLWLQGELHAWVYGNLADKWDVVARRHAAGAGQRSAADVLQTMLGGYGGKKSLVQRVLEKVRQGEAGEEAKEEELATWKESGVLRRFVELYLKERFPTVCVLNKIDRKESEKWIPKLLEVCGEDRAVLCSAAAEQLLRSHAKKKNISYSAGGDDFEELEGFKQLDDKSVKQLQQIRDLILFRFGSTGVHEALNRAAEAAGVVPVYLVRSIHNFSSSLGGEGCFRDLLLVRRGSTFAEVAEHVSGAPIEYIECAQTGQRVADDAIVTDKNNVVHILFKDVQ